MANATARISDITQPARDDVNVSVIDRLPRGDAAVDAHVHAVNPIAFRQLATDLPNESE